MPYAQLKPQDLLDRPTDFGRRPGAYPLSVAREPDATAAAWAQHLLIRRFRVWLTALGFGSVNAWTRAVEVNADTWGNIVAGRRWLQLSEVVFLAGQAPNAREKQSALQEFADALKGDAYPELPAGAARPVIARRDIAGRRVTRPTATTRAKEGEWGGATSVDSVWRSLDLLAAAHGVKPPTALISYKREGSSDVMGTEAGEVIAVLPDPGGPPLPLVGPHVLVEGLPMSGNNVRVLTYHATPDDQGEFVTVDATVLPDGELHLDVDPEQ